MQQGSVTANTKSACNRSASTRSQEIVICKEIFLISAVIRPYIAFLLKFSYSLESIKHLKNKLFIETYQAWTIINLLKMIISVTGNFTMIGRYYIRSYGFLVILLTKAFSGCIRIFMDILNKYVNSQKNKYNDVIDVQSKQLGEFIKMLQQIAKINDQLLPLYLSKYFFDYIQDVPQPRWINTSSSDFDRIFQLKKTSQNPKDFSCERKQHKSIKKKSICQLTQKV